VEEPPRPTRAVVVPELAERLLQEIGLVQPPIDPEQQLQGLLPSDGEVLPTREQVVLLPLDEAAFLPREPRVLPLAHLVHRRPQMFEDVELVVDDPGLRGVTLLEGGLAERLPHVHDGQADLPAFLRAEPGEELVQARLGAVLAAEPDRSPPLQVADDDAVAVVLGNGDLVDADDPRGGTARPTKLFPHVLLVQLLDGMPVQAKFLRDCLDGAVATAPPHEGCRRHSARISAGFARFFRERALSPNDFYAGILKLRRFLGELEVTKPSHSTTGIASMDHAT